MILSKTDIRRAVDAGEIGFTPGLEETQWGEASIDLRLGFQFTKFKDAKGLTVSVADGLKTIGGLGLWATKTLKENDELGARETYELAPGGLILAYSRIHTHSSKSNWSDRRTKYLRKNGAEYASDCSMDSARLERPGRTGNCKSRNVYHQTYAPNRPTMSTHLFRT
jgi:hypothetical protein